MKTYRITTFRSLKSAISDEFDLTWDEVVDFFTSGHIQTEEKDSLPLFNSIHFKTIDEVSKGPVDGWWEDRSGKKVVRRKNINALQVEMLVVDYDGGVTLGDGRSP